MCVKWQLLCRAAFVSALSFIASAVFCLKRYGIVARFCLFGFQRDFVCLVAARYICWTGVLVVQTKPGQRMKRFAHALAFFVFITIPLLVAVAYLFPSLVLASPEPAAELDSASKGALFGIMVAVNFVGDIVYFLAPCTKEKSTPYLKHLVKSVARTFLNVTFLYLWFGILYITALLPRMQEGMSILGAFFGFVLPVVRVFVVWLGNLASKAMAAQLNLEKVQAEQMKVQCAAVTEVVFGLTATLTALKMGAFSLPVFFIMFVPAEII